MLDNTADTGDTCLFISVRSCIAWLMMDFTKSNQNLIISPSAKYNVMMILNQPNNSEVIRSIVGSDRSKILRLILKLFDLEVETEI